MRDAIVIKGEYKGRIGKATEINEVGNVMFYPKEGIHPYRVCLVANEIRYIENR
jgi:hypothetical protein